MNRKQFELAARQQRILLIGETITDINSDVEIIRPAEGSRAVTMRVTRETISRGGAALVSRNLMALGSVHQFLSCHLPGNGHRVTKQRLWLDGAKAFQIDHIHYEPCRWWMPSLEPHLAHADKVVVADYRHGLLDEELIRTIVEFCTDHQKPLYVSSQVSQSESNHRAYASPQTIFVLNEHECHCVQGNRERALPAAVMVQLECQACVVTIGERGARRAVSSDYSVFQSVEYPAMPAICVDATGAGDAFFAAYVLSDDVEFANRWAAATVSHLGADPPDANKFWQQWEQDRAA